MTFPKHLFALLFVMALSCSKPGTAPGGQPPMATLDSIAPVVDRFNQAAPEQVQVIAMFSPT